MTPKIGVPRLYPGDTIPILYPGEKAHARVAIDQVTFEQLLVRGVPIPVTEWLVEPMEGWRGRWLRWRYRLWGQWLRTGKPELTADVTAEER